MSLERIDGITVITKANVYFDGRCVSHSIVASDGTERSVGVVLPAELTFETGRAEIMETVAGSCEVLLPGRSDWRRIGSGGSFQVPAQSSFRIRVTQEPYHYLCHYV